MGRAATGRGRAGQAFRLREPSMVDGTTADSLAADQRAATGWPGRQVQAPRKEPPADSGPEPPDQGGTRARVGWTSRPLMPDATHFTANTRSRRGRAACGHALVESESLSFIR